MILPRNWGGGGEGDGERGGWSRLSEFPGLDTVGLSASLLDCITHTKRSLGRQFP